MFLPADLCDPASVLTPSCAPSHQLCVCDILCNCAILQLCKISAGAEVPRAQRTCATALGSHQDRLVNRLFTFPQRSQLDATISLPARWPGFCWIVVEGSKSIAKGPTDPSWVLLPKKLPKYDRNNTTEFWPNNKLGPNCCQALAKLSAVTNL